MTKNNLEKDLYQLMAGLYGPYELQELIPALLKKVADFTPVSGKKGLDETDAILITYGNSIINHQDAPLQVLNQFVQEKLDNTIPTLHLLPCFPYSSDDGFSVIDYYKINPDLGDWDDIKALKSHSSIMFDMVINHMSAQSDWFKAYLAGDEKYQDYFIEADPSLDYSSVTRPRALPLLTSFSTREGTRHLWTTFSADQVDLNFRSPKVLCESIDILLYYIQQGGAFIRLDAIGFAWKEMNTSCLHLPQTHALIQVMRRIVDEVAPHVKLITETNVPHKDNMSYFGNGHNEAHMIYQFPLPPLTLHTLHSGDATHMQNWLQSLGEVSKTTSFFNFLSSHDGIGVRPVEGILSKPEIDELIHIVQHNKGKVSFKDNGDGTQSPYELNINYFSAMQKDGDSQELWIQRYMAAQALLLSLAGVPGIYIHSLLGSENDISGVERLGYNRAINREKLDYATLMTQLEYKASKPYQVLSAFKHLLKIRQTQAAFAPHASQRIVVKSPHCLSLVRDESLVVLINVTDQAQSFDLSDMGVDGYADVSPATRERVIKAAK